MKVSVEIVEIIYFPDGPSWNPTVIGRSAANAWYERSWAEAGKWTWRPLYHVMESTDA